MVKKIGHAYEARPQEKTMGQEEGSRAMALALSTREAWNSSQ